MLIAIIGENCVGKSTLANMLNEKYKAKIYSGKDYLRMEKNPSLALIKFKEILNNSINGENTIYIITEQEHLKILPKGTKRIVLTASLDVIKERFKSRMKGNLPEAVIKMLEKKHGMYDNLECDLKLNTDYDIKLVFDFLKNI